MREILTVARDLWQSLGDIEVEEHRFRAGRLTFKLLHIADILAVTGNWNRAPAKRAGPPRLPDLRSRLAVRGFALVVALLAMSDYGISVGAPAAATQAAGRPKVKEPSRERDPTKPKTKLDAHKTWTATLRRAAACSRSGSTSRSCRTRRRCS